MRVLTFAYSCVEELVFLKQTNRPKGAVRCYELAGLAAVPVVSGVLVRSKHVKTSI